MLIAVWRAVLTVAGPAGLVAVLLLAVVFWLFAPAVLPSDSTALRVLIAALPVLVWAAALTRTLTH